MAKSVRLCRTEPAIFKEDIIMSKIVNEAKIGHLRSGLLPLLPEYTLLTQEEIFRLAVSLVMFRRCSWMISL